MTKSDNGHNTVLLSYTQYNTIGQTGKKSEKTQTYSRVIWNNPDYYEIQPAYYVASFDRNTLQNVKYD